MLVTVTGTLLILVSWGVILLAAIGTGLLPAIAIHSRWSIVLVRTALWWGLGLLTIFVAILSVALPLRSAEAAAAVLGLVAGLTILGVWWGRRLRRERRHHPLDLSKWSVILVLSVGAAVVYLALAALGPVTNYDSGLYHLGAISYAGDFRAIPGLTNLYFPLGYANVHFPIAAFLGNGPWDGVGYRLLNGALIAALALDLSMRALDRRKGVGFFVLVVGSAAALVPMVALSDYWVTSPTSDSAVLILSVVSAAYLADAVSGERWGVSAIGVAVGTAVLTVMLRPTMAVFAGATVLVAWLVAHQRTRYRRTEERARLRIVAMLCGAFSLTAAMVVALRDIILSGWLQYPLSLISLDVPWKAADPTQFRVPTLGAARDPEDLWVAAEGWGWVPAWLARLPQQWEPYDLLLLALVALVLTLVAMKAPVAFRGRALLAVMAPSVVSVGFWWVLTPPAFRFIWGPLFLVGALPAGWSLWRLSRAKGPWARSRVLGMTTIGLSAPVVVVVIVSAVFRFDADGLTEQRTWSLGVEIPYVVAPVVDAPTRVVTLDSGLTVLTPTLSDQCWTKYPLCSPQVAGSVRFAGDGIQDGFLP